MPSSAPQLVAPRHLEIVRWVREVIERRYRTGTPLTVIARMGGLSRSHLSRIFKRVTGLSLKRYITRVRLEAAKGFLRTAEMKIQEVARSVGYWDASHFDRVFRKWEGQTPSAYRRNALRKAIPVTLTAARGASSRRSPVSLPDSRVVHP